MLIRPLDSLRWSLRCMLALAFFATACGSDPSEKGDPLPPLEIEIVSGPDSLTGQTGATFELACNRDEACDFECGLDGRQLAACEPQVEYEQLDDGQHFFEARATDTSGEVSDLVVWEWEIDTEGPTIENLDGPTDPTNESTGAFTFECSKQDCEFLCTMDGAEPSVCQSGVEYTELDDGEHVFTVQATDTLGNTGPESEWRWSIDTVPPVIEDLETPSALTSSQQAQFEFECSKQDCEFRCKLDGGQEESCQSGVSYDSLADGEHTFSVYAIDALGTQGPASEWTWSIDTTNVFPDNLDGPDEFTNQTSATFDFDCSKSDCEYECKLDNGAFHTCDTGVTYDNLDDGPHQFTARATDSVGNSGPDADWSWTVDTIAPSVENLTGPDEYSSQTTAQFEFECSENACEFECEFSETGTLSSCQSGVSFNGLSDGDYTFSIRAIDRAGNESSLESWTWTVDTTDPTVVFTQSPADPSSDVDATVAFECSNEAGCQFECALHESPGTSSLQDCTSPRVLTGLQPGDYEFEVRATDLAGNQATESVQWTQYFGWETTAHGEEHSCGIGLDGTLWCWGANFDGQLGSGDTTDRERPTRVGTETNWTTVTAGDFFSCGLRADGTLWCWGNGNGYLGNGASGSNSDETTPIQVGASTDWADLASGRRHTCAIRTDDSLWCWGTQTEGALGLGSNIQSSTPAQISGAGSWRTVSAGRNHTCAIATDDTLWCWGSDEYGQLGVSGQSNQGAPVQVGSSTQWDFISTGDGHTCGMQSDATIWCWGDNYYGQLGMGDTTERDLPAQVGSNSNWESVSSRTGFHNCATRDDGTLWCWGRGERGRLGQNDIDDRLSPAQVGSGSDWRSLAVGPATSCAIKDDATLHCWGANEHAQLGLTGSGAQSKPVQVDTQETFASIGAGLSHGCGVSQSGTLSCWGSNIDGQLGLGDRAQRRSPEQVGSGTQWQTTSAGVYHQCGTQTDGSLWCWGDNNFGQLGLGDSNDRDTPEQVTFAVDATEVSAASEHTCAIGSDNTLWCWGRNTDGKLGIGNAGDQLEPTQVGSDQDWTHVATSAAGTCGIRQDGTLWCWGQGLKESGVFGGTAPSRMEPEQVGSDSDWRAISGQTSSAFCGLRDDDSLWCWGGDYTRDGDPLMQIGSSTDWNSLASPTHGDKICGVRLNGTLWCWEESSSSVVPSQVGTASNWSNVSAGSTFTITTDTSGQAWTFGSNLSGQLGNGTAYYATPQAIPAP